jgi:hypothetical protein
MTEPTPTAENDAPERKPLGAPCRYCGSGDTWVEWRLEAKPLGSFSLAGAQMKFSANRWPYAVCDGCGHVSRGEPTTVIPPGTGDTDD